MSETTLRDTIADAVETHEPEAEFASTVYEARPDRLRDEAGRFARTEQRGEPMSQSAPASAQAPRPDAAQPEPKAVPRPSSWRRDYEQDWEALPERIREYINEREGQYARGVSTYKNQWDQAAPIYEAMQPFMADLRQNNINPAQWIQNLGSAHKALVQGTPEQKLQMFAQLANEYGVPLQGLTGQRVDPQLALLAQELGQIKNQWNSFQTRQQQAEINGMWSDIHSFAASAPHFDEVRETMAQLLQGGVASDLKTAYDKAIRLHDKLWNQHQSAQARRAGEERQRSVAEKKAKAVSPRSASPTANTTSGGKKSLRDQIAESVEAISGSI